MAEARGGGQGRADGKSRAGNSRAGNSRAPNSRAPNSRAGNSRAPNSRAPNSRAPNSLPGSASPRGARPGRLRSFNPLRVGALECALWVAYYRREWARFLMLSVRVVRGGFGMDWIRTVYGAWLVLRANQLWAAAGPDGAAGARRCMRRFYALLRLVHGEPVDPARAAQLEVEWWAVHRAHQRGDDGDARPLVDALSRLYAFVYGIDEVALWPAAEHRARAMDISDRWVREGCAMDSPLLAAERSALIRSYAALLAAVHR